MNEDFLVGKQKQFIDTCEVLWRRRGADDKRRHEFLRERKMWNDNPKTKLSEICIWYEIFEQKIRDNLTFKSLPP